MGGMFLNRPHDRGYPGCIYIDNSRYGLAVDHTASPRLFRTWLSGNLLDTVVSLGGEAL
jgi:hypothetical protein